MSNGQVREVAGSVKLTAKFMSGMRLNSNLTIDQGQSGLVLAFILLARLLRRLPETPSAEVAKSQVKSNSVSGEGASVCPSRHSFIACDCSNTPAPPPFRWIGITYQ